MKANDPKLLKEGTKVALKSHHGLYLTAKKDGSVGQTKRLDAWEFWEVEKAPGGRIGLKSAHGNYLSAKKGLIGSMGQDEALKEDESFEVVPYSIGLAFKTTHGKFISAKNDPKKSVLQNKGLGNNETWFVLPKTKDLDDTRVSLKTHSGKYVSAQDNGLVTQSNGCEAYELFTLEKQGNLVYIKTAHGKYLSAQKKGLLHPVVQKKENKEWETFTLVEVNQVPDGFGIRTNHGTFVSAGNKLGPINHVKEMKENEIFVIKKF